MGSANIHTMRQRIERDMRRESVAAMLCRGITSMSEMARRHGVNVATIRRDVEIVRKEMLTRDTENALSQARLRVAQLEEVVKAAWASYERSRQDEMITTVAERKCDCKEGLIPDKDHPGRRIECPKCLGQGVLTETTQRVRGQAGDSSFLLAIKACIVEIARIEGLYPAISSTLKRDIQRATLPDGTIVEKVEELCLEGATDSIVRALAAFDDVVQSAKKNGKRVIETQAVEKPDGIIETGGGGAGVP